MTRKWQHQLALFATFASATAAAQSVTIPDAALRAAVEMRLEKSPGATITRTDMATIPGLLVRGTANLSGPLRWQATSLDEGVATVAIRRGLLIVEPEPGAEGEATIEVVATDSAGRSAVVRFRAVVEFSHPPVGGWRTATLDAPDS